MERTRKLLTSLSNLARENEGYGCKAMRIHYKGTLQSLLLYGCELWGRESLKTKVLKMTLLTFQRKALIMVNKAYRRLIWCELCDRWSPLQSEYNWAWNLCLLPLCQRQTPLCQNHYAMQYLSGHGNFNGSCMDLNLQKVYGVPNVVTILKRPKWPE